MRIVESIFFYMYLLRAQILGFALLWPIAGRGFRNPMFRGLTDLKNGQLAWLEIFSIIYVVFLVCTAHIVLMWSRDRVRVERVAPRIAAPRASYSYRLTIAASATLVWVLFIRDVVVNWTLLTVLGTLVGAAATILFCFLVFFGNEDLQDPQPAVDPTAAEQPDASAAQPTWPARAADLIKRLVYWLFAQLGDGYSRDGVPLYGHITALVIFLYFLFAFYIVGVQFGSKGWKLLGFTLVEPWDSTGSTLLLALFGMQLFVSVLTALTFFFDRFRVPVTLVLAAVVTGASVVNNNDATFFARAVDESQIGQLKGPRETLASAPQRIIVVSAAGGGIQSSGWTAQVLAGLTQENADFRDRLKVLSGVSGGSVGTAFYLASYPNVWSEQAWSMTQVVEAATSSFLEDVAWGLVYPDLHRMILPFTVWRNMDRGRALEAAFARRANNSLHQTVLGLARNVPQGLPVFILNATLSDKALPVVFTNSRFPDPASQAEHQRGIRSFWRDYRLDTGLETAMRVSATFPYISPAARPEPLPGIDTFVDGGFFDNSGLYSMMAWLEEAAEGQQPGAHEVLLILVDAFPEPGETPNRRVNLQWYDQLLLPLETVLRIRETGQAARTQYEFPLFTHSLAETLKITPIRFRYTPSPQCALDEPPLSWHLTAMEKSCLSEGWIEEGVRESREKVKSWLAGTLDESGAEPAATTPPAPVTQERR